MVLRTFTNNKVTISFNNLFYFCSHTLAVLHLVFTPTGLDNRIFCYRIPYFKWLKPQKSMLTSPDFHVLPRYSYIFFIFLPSTCRTVRLSLRFRQMLRTQNAYGTDSDWMVWEACDTVYENIITITNARSRRRSAWNFAVFAQQTNTRVLFIFFLTTCYHSCFVYVCVFLRAHECTCRRHIIYIYICI